MLKRATLFLLLGLLCLGHAAARTLQQADYGTASDSSRRADTADTTATTGEPTSAETNNIGIDLSSNEEEENTFRVYAIKPWALGMDYSSMYPGPNGLEVPAGAILAFTWGNMVHGVYKIPTSECPTTFKDGLNGMEAIQEPINGLNVPYVPQNLDPQITVTYKVKEVGVHYFACPVGSGSHCRRGMKLKVTAKAPSKNAKVAG